MDFFVQLIGVLQKQPQLRQQFKIDQSVRSPWQVDKADKIVRDQWDWIFPLHFRILGHLRGESWHLQTLRRLVSSLFWLRGSQSCEIIGQFQSIEAISSKISQNGKEIKCHQEEETAKKKEGNTIIKRQWQHPYRPFYQVAEKIVASTAGALVVITG